jgi:hypothetical protein
MAGRGRDLTLPAWMTAAGGAAGAGASAASPTNKRSRDPTDDNGAPTPEAKAPKPAEAEAEAAPAAAPAAAAAAAPAQASAGSSAWQKMMNPEVAAAAAAAVAATTPPHGGGGRGGTGGGAPPPGITKPQSAAEKELERRMEMAMAEEYSHGPPGDQVKISESKTYLDACFKRCSKRQDELKARCVATAAQPRSRADGQQQQLQQLLRRRFCYPLYLVVMATFFAWLSSPPPSSPYGRSSAVTTDCPAGWLAAGGARR